MKNPEQGIWSDWLDFDKKSISNVPQSPGIFMMHASMKILYIDNSENLRNALLEVCTVPCISDATRFRYMETSSHEKTKEELIKDYSEKHDGKLPKCMETMP